MDEPPSTHPPIPSPFTQLTTIAIARLLSLSLAFTVGAGVGSAKPSPNPSSPGPTNPNPSTIIGTPQKPDQAKPKTVGWCTTV
ncbi:hypothetical protein [Leptothermofonsia sp. ETS-13]|uniref:hypothetical protein n=1 Tax=Leptothermofonsia sp. ETS-13 TaxID=3035696 RepID=UPI003B9EBDEE